MYVVLYEKEINTAQEGYFDKWLYISVSVATFKTFDHEKEAAEFATKNDGVVLIPAELKLSINKPEKK